MNEKTEHAVKIVNNLYRKEGGEDVLTMMVLLYNWIWKSEYAPDMGRERVVVNVFKKGDKADQGKCRKMTLLSTISTVGKTLCEIIRWNGKNVGEGQKYMRRATTI